MEVSEINGQQYTKHIFLSYDSVYAWACSSVDMHVQIVVINRITRS
jgi:hypothetical protein